MRKYLYQLVDSENTLVSRNFIREGAREHKRLAEIADYSELFGVKPPYKIVRYELVNPKVVR